MHALAVDGRSNVLVGEYSTQKCEDQHPSDSDMEKHPVCSVNQFSGSNLLYRAIFLSSD